MTATPASIVVVGEALVDIVHRASGAVDVAPGGSPANVALTLGRLGRAPTLVTRLGHDDHGDRVRRWLAGSDVTVEAVSAPRTATATAHLDADGSARYEFALDWDLGDAVESLGRGVVEGAGVVHFGSVAALLMPGADHVAALIGAVRAQTTITYDPNIRPSLVTDPERARERVADLISLADVVKASDEDVRWLHPGEEPADVAREWQARGPAIVVITLGADGCIAATRDGIVRVPAVPTTVVDTVGAGDSFMGALIDGLIDHAAPTAALREAARAMPLAELEAVLRRCAIVSAVTVSRPGADPPRRSELSSLQL